MQLTCSLFPSETHKLYTVITCTQGNISRDVLCPFISVKQTDTYLAVSVGVGCSWVAAGGERVGCTQWQGSVECRDWVLDCSAGPYTDYWNPSAVIQTGWIKERTEQEWEHRQVTNAWGLWISEDGNYRCTMFISPLNYSINIPKGRKKPQHIRHLKCSNDDDRQGGIMQ